MTRRSFTPEFKQECAELVTKHGYQVKQAAEAMNVGLSTLQRWLRQFRQEQNGVTWRISCAQPLRVSRFTTMFSLIANCSAKCNKFKSKYLT